MSGLYELRQVYELKLRILGRRPGFLSLEQSMFKYYILMLADFSSSQLSMLTALRVQRE